MRVIIDGVEMAAEDATISIFDWGLQRGFGAFEVIRSYGGRLFRGAGHLDRLQRSLAALHIPCPDRADLERWAATVAGAGGDGTVRIIVTGGGRDPLFEAPPATIVSWDPLPTVPDHLRLEAMIAGWHPGTDRAMFHGVKWLSYAPNMAATDAARRDGFDDALLLTAAGDVLEGPTFTVAWVADDVLETPGMEMGILASITREVLMESCARLGIEVRQGRFPLSRLLEADEAMALSTTKEVTPIAAVGEDLVGNGPVASELAAVHRVIVSEELG
ncbi:MAG: aminotransferase class IV [Actinobacteria bacterium]|nr:aminotransferase class IV [Actinomycetota bacterium]